MDTLDIRERYVNFYTDFAFKKLFGTEVNKECLISFLNALFDGKEEISDLTYLNVEQALQEAVFKRFFEQAEIANFTQEERRDYRESQKDFWDLFAVTETAEKRGRAEGRAEGIAIGEERGIAIGEERGIAIGAEREREKAYQEKLASARSLKSLSPLSNASIAEALGLTENEVENA